MKCDDCDFAEWDRTKAGRLHPQKGGVCKRLERHPLDLRIPAAFYWGTAHLSAPNPSGGYIERGHGLHAVCVFKSVTP